MSEKPQAGDYTVEYSKSNRSTCKLTNKTIKKDALRIGKIVQSQSFDGTYPMWYNFEDWAKDKKLVKEFQTKCKKVHGLSKIRLEDQETIKKLMGQSSDSNDGDDNLSEEQKKKKIEFEEENKKIWEIKDKLKKLKSLPSLRSMLSENNQIEKGGEDLLIDRCALGLMFGNMPACPNDECEDGYMTFSGGVFKCHGKLPWAKCDYSLNVDEAFEKATEWVIPDDIAESKYFEDFKFEKHKKVNFALDTTVRAAAASSSEEKKEEEEEKEEIDPEKEKLPLGNFKIACSGKLSMKQSELQEIIEENGATFLKDVSSGCTHLVCSENEYDKETTKVKKAKKQGVLIVDEDWVHMSVEKERKLTEDETKEYVHYNPQDKKRKKADTQEEEGEGEAVPKKKKLTIKGRAAVDEDCEDADVLHVFEKGDDVYSVHLNLTDLSTGANSYYVVQLLEHDTRKNYYVFRKWGRLNTNIGSNKLTEYGSDYSSARTEFENTYYDKTGNYWDDRHNFQKRPGKFLPIDVDYGSDETDLDKLQSEMNKDYKGKLHPEIANLVKLIFDVQTMKQTLKEIEIDTEKLPLGKLKKSHISKGYEVLTEIQNLIKTVREKEKEAGVFMEDDPPATTSSLDTTTTATATPSSSVDTSSTPVDTTSATPSSSADTSSTTPAATVEKPKKPKTSIHQQSKQQFLTLSNKFYTIIPTSNPEIIDDEDVLSAKVKMIEALQEMEIATSLLKKDEESEEDPLDGYYKKLKTHLEPLGKDSDMFKIVDTFLQNTHASTHREFSLELLDAFEVDREGESERFKKFEDLHNRRLLWHGSRVSNFAGILSQGLRIAPPEAPVTGYMFGKGIYFADMSSKSANYCRTSPDQSTGILLLCDVACGNLYERLQADYIEKLPKGYHTCFGHGRTEPDETMSQYIDNGKVMVPLGTPSASKVPRHASLLYNEFIVYDIDQVKIRYLLKVNFKYNRRY